MAGRSLKTQAILLRRTNYGEADRIINLITPLGQKSVLAKGVRREKSRLAGGVELLSLSDVVIHEGKSDLGILTSARMQEFYSHIIEDYSRLSTAYWVLKDINKLSRDVDEPEFFELTLQALRALNQPDIALAVIEIWYRLQAAILLGVGVNLATDINGMKLLEDTPYRFDISNMSFAYDERGEYTAEHIKLLRVASAQAPEVIARISDLAKLLPACQQIAQFAHE